MAGFGKSFDKAFVPAQQAAAQAAAQDSAIRLKHKLNQEADEAKEERELSRQKDKTIAIATETFGDVLSQDKIKKIADAGGTVEDIRQAASVAQELRKEGQDARFDRLQRAIDKRNLATEQQVSVSFTPQEIEDARIEGIDLREEPNLQRIRERAAQSSTADLARFPQKAALKNALDTEAITREIKEATLVAQKLANAGAEREEKAAKRASLDELRATEAGAFEIFTEPGEIGGLFRDDGTGKKTFGIGKRKITPEDRRVQALISRINRLDGEQAALEEALKDGVTEQELRALTREMRMSREDMLSRLGITEEEVDKSGVR